MRAIWNWLVAKLWGGTTYSVAIEPDVPDVVSQRTLYLVGEQREYWLAVMKCPCGCGTDIQLPMSSNARPRWKYSGTTSKPTLSPSVWRKSGCRSHFILRQGHVIWCQ